MLLPVQILVSEITSALIHNIEMCMRLFFYTNEYIYMHMPLYLRIH